MKTESLKSRILLVVTGIVMVFSSGCRVTPGDRETAAPNIILFFVDDNVAETIKAGGLCPNISSIANQGISFTRSYTPAGVCGPSRFCVLTGRVPSRCINEKYRIPESRIHGSTSMGGMTIEGQLIPGEPKILSKEWNLGKLMQLGGYKTFYTGKVHGHMQDSPVDPELVKASKTDPWKNQELMRSRLQASGWDWAEALSAGNLNSWGEEKNSQHCPELRADATIRFIEKNSDQPFLCYIAENLMHAPPPHLDMKKDPLVAFDGIRLEKLPDVMPSRESVFERVREAGLDETRSAALLWLDDMVGAILGKLDELGLRENTMIVFIQDNGHSWGGKNSCYEGGIRVDPVYISWPAGEIIPGSTSSSLIQSIDLIPTFMDVAGINKPVDCQLDGNSILPILNDPQAKVHDFLYAEMGYARAVTEDRWKYIAFRIPESRQLNSLETKWYEEMEQFDRTGWTQSLQRRILQSGDNIPHVSETYRWRPDNYFDTDQLYDISVDVQETNNLAANPNYSAILARMKEKMREVCLELPGTFAEFKTEDDCSEDFRAMLENARLAPIAPIDHENFEHRLKWLQSKAPKKNMN